MLKRLIPILFWLHDASCAKIALCAGLNSISHLRPIIATGIALQDSHHVTIIAPNPTLVVSQKIGGHHFHELSTGNHDLYKYYNTHQPTGQVTLKERMGLLVEMLTVGYVNRLQAIDEHLQDLKPDVMVADLMGLDCMEAAEKYDIPVIAAAPLLHPAITPAPSWLSNSFGNEPMTTESLSIFSRILQFANMVETFGVFRHVDNVMNDYRLRHGLQPKGFFQQISSRPVALLANTFYPLELPYETNPNTALVGPMILHQRQDRGLGPHVQKFLDERTRVIYIALGQHTKFTADAERVVIQCLMRVLDDGLADGVIWIVRDQDLKQFPSDDRFMLEPWTSQAQVLEHPSTKLFISHHGGDSTMEGVFAGVPMLGVPDMGDQHSNAQRVEYLGCSEWIDISSIASNESGFESRLRSLLSNPSYRTNMSNLSTIAQRQSIIGPQKAAAVVETVIHFGPDALKNYGWRMNGFKRYNYDLMLVVGAVLVILVWGMVKVWRGLGGSEMIVSIFRRLMGNGSMTSKKVD